MARTHTVPNQITVHAVEMPETHRIVHCAVASRNGKALAYYPCEWHYREFANRIMPSMQQVQKDARWK